jgi:prolyl oligopeptidase
VYFHRFGEEPQTDQEIFCAGEDPNTYVGLLLCQSADMLVFVVCTLGKGQRVSLYVSSARCPSSAKPLLEDLGGVFVPFFAQGRLLACTDIGSPNRRIVEIDPCQSSKESWREVVPETRRRIQQFAACGSHIFVTRVERFSMYLESFGLDGKSSGEMISARQGTLRLLNRGTANANLFFAFSSIRNPLTIYCQNVESGELRTWRSVKINFKSEKILVEELSVTSNDGVTVPVLVARKRGLPRLRPRPVFLTALATASLLPMLHSHDSSSSKDFCSQSPR